MSDSRTQAIEKVSYTHEAMVDLLVAKPDITQGELARHFGYTLGWVSRIIRADAFREVLAKRKEELTDPLVLQAIDKQFEALMEQGLRILQEELEVKPSFDKALKVVETSSRALGYGAKQPGVQINQQFVVHTPHKAESSEEWLASRVVASG